MKFIQVLKYIFKHLNKSGVDKSFENNEEHHAYTQLTKSNPSQTKISKESIEGHCLH